MLFASGFMDAVIFSHNRACGMIALQRRNSCLVAEMLAMIFGECR